MTEHERHNKERGGIILAAIAGYADAVGFIALFGVFISHMSGTSTRLAVELGGGNWIQALPYAVVVAAFFTGCVASSAYVASKRFGNLRGLLAIEALLLLAVGLAGAVATDVGDVTQDAAIRVVLGGSGAFAMGMQSAAVRHATGISVNTTFISGMLTKAGERTAAWLRRERGAGRDLLRHGSVWAAFVCGGVVGAVTVTVWGIIALIAPAAALGALAAHPRFLTA